MSATLQKNRKPSTNGKQLWPRPCLLALGINMGPRDTTRNGRPVCRNPEKLPPETLWDLHERARTQYRAKAKQLHPDYGGDARQFAELTRVWKFLRRWFLKFGIE